MYVAKNYGIDLLQKVLRCQYFITSIFFHDGIIFCNSLKVLISSQVTCKQKTEPLTSSKANKIDHISYKIFNSENKLRCFSTRYEAKANAN